MAKCKKCKGQGTHRDGSKCKWCVGGVYTPPPAAEPDTDEDTRQRPGAATIRGGK